MTDPITNELICELTTLGGVTLHDNSLIHGEKIHHVSVLLGPPNHEVDGIEPYLLVGLYANGLTNYYEIIPRADGISLVWRGCPAVVTYCLYVAPHIINIRKINQVIKSILSELA